MEALVNKLRVRWRDGTPEDRVKISRAVLSRLASGDFTDAGLRTAFSLNVTQWNTLKTKMQNIVAAADLIESSTGE